MTSIAEVPPRQTPRLFSKLLLCFISVCGCNGVDLAALPPVPQVDTSTFLPGVKKQLDKTFAAIEQNPGSSRLNGKLAKMLQTYKQYESANIMYQRIRLLEPNEFEWSYLHGFVLGSLGRPDESEAAFREALRIEPTNPLAKVRLASVLLGQGDSNEARSLYEGVLSERADLSEAHFGFGQLLIQEGEFDRAIDQLNEAVRLSGDFGAAHYQLGLAYRAKKEMDQAERHFRMAKLKNDSAPTAATQY